MNLQKPALILTLSLIGLTSINCAGLKPAFADQAPAPQHQDSGKTIDPQTQDSGKTTTPGVFSES
jgi:hypothetical protein